MNEHRRDLVAVLCRLVVYKSADASVRITAPSCTFPCRLKRVCQVSNSKPDQMKPHVLGLAVQIQRPRRHTLVNLRLKLSLPPRGKLKPLVSYIQKVSAAAASDPTLPQWELHVFSATKATSSYLDLL